MPASCQLHNSHKKSEIVIPIPKENPNSSRFPLMDLTNPIYHSVNQQFQAITGIDFATAQSKSKEIGLQKKKSKVEKQKEGMLQERLYLTLKGPGITPKSSG